MVVVSMVSPWQWDLFSVAVLVKSHVDTHIMDAALMVQLLRWTTEEGAVQRFPTVISPCMDAAMMDTRLLRVSTMKVVKEVLE